MTNQLTTAENRPLRAYMVWCGDAPVETGAALVFAPTARVAKNIGWNSCSFDADFIHTQTQRMPENDRLLDPTATEPYYVTDEAVLRKAGWHCETDHMCASCELYDMDGQFPACPECNQCAECGHEETCPNGK